MGKTTQTSTNTSQVTAKSTSTTLKHPPSTKNNQQKKKSRSCSGRRRLATADKGTEKPQPVTDVSKLNQTHPLVDSSDNEQEHVGQSKNPGKLTSVVHQYAKKISDTEYECHTCQRRIRCAVDSTANIRRHLVTIHGKTEVAYQSHTSTNRIIAPDRKRLLDEKAIEAIIIDGRSWGDFSRTGMSKFLEVAVPGYKGPCSRTIQRNLARLYMEKKEELKQNILKMSNVSITTDMWRGGRNRHYLCVTLHSMNAQYVYKSQVLSFRKFRGRSFAKQIRSHLINVLREFGLIGKITSTTTDNGSNIKLATGNRQYFGIRFFCLAHALNLTVHNGLNIWGKQEEFKRRKK